MGRPSPSAVAQAQVAQAQTAVVVADVDLKDTVITAPFSGVISRRFKSVGDYLTNMPPADVVELVSLDGLEAEIQLPEAYYASVKAGVTPIVLRSPLLKSDLVTKVTRVVPIIDPAQGTFVARIAISGEQRGELVPGAFVNVEVILAGRNEAVIVPTRAVVSRDGKTFVFMVKDGKMARTPVEVGDRLTESVVIKSGLAPGQDVVCGPAEMLKDDAKVGDLQRKD